MICHEKRFHGQSSVFCPSLKKMGSISDIFWKFNALHTQENNKFSLHVSDHHECH